MPKIVKKFKEGERITVNQLKDHGLFELPSGEVVRAFKGWPTGITKNDRSWFISDTGQTRIPDDIPEMWRADKKFDLDEYEPANGRLDDWFIIAKESKSIEVDKSVSIDMIGYGPDGSNLKGKFNETSRTAEEDEPPGTLMTDVDGVFWVSVGDQSWRRLTRPDDSDSAFHWSVGSRFDGDELVRGFVWEVDESAPAEPPRTSGEIKRREVRLGEGFEYADGKEFKGHKIYVTDKYQHPEEMPRDGVWLYSTQEDGRYDGVKDAGDKLVRLVPLWNAGAIRTSGEIPRSEVRPGESFVYLEGETPGQKVIVPADSKKPTDLPEGEWLWAPTSSAPITSTTKVRLIPNYRDEIRTSGETVRRLVRLGESFEYVEGISRGVKVFITADGKYPKDLPSGWSWDTSPGDHSDKVRLIPNYRAVTVSITPTAPVLTYKHGNSGRTYSFLAGQNEYDGGLGWKPIDLIGGDGKGPAFDPVAPVMAVHDLMEHFPGDEYAPHNEYMAQGAMLWLRFEGNFFAGADLAATVIKPAFGMLFHHIRKGTLDTQLFKDGEKVDGVTSTGNPFAHMKQATAYELLKLVGAAKTFVDNNYYDSTRDRLLLSLARGIPWMVHGYMRAQDRYRGLDKNRLVRLYKSTVEQIKNVVNDGHLKLTMSYESYSAKVELLTAVKV